MRAPAVLGLVLVTVAAAAPLAAQSGPPARAHHALVYDPVRRAVLLAGGSTPQDSGRRFAFFGDLWAFDGSAWTRIGEGGQQLSGFRLASDASGRVFAFGGYTAAGRSVGLFRRLEDSAWVTLEEVTAMPVTESGFVADVGRGRLVAFGGSGGPGGAVGETWEYDGSAWSRVAAEGPPARQGHVMVYDERRGRIVVFGGMASGPPGRRPPLLGDTWEFDGRAWSRLDVPGPSARASAGAAWDARRGVVLVFGGMTDEGFQGDTWTWDGRRWLRVATAGPEPRAMGHLAYDPRRDRVVLFGGRMGWPDGDLGDTWEWDGTVWARVRP